MFNSEQLEFWTPAIPGLMLSGEEIEEGQPLAAVQPPTSPVAIKDIIKRDEMPELKDLAIDYDTEWHGWGNDIHGYMHVGKVKWRKSYALYLIKGNHKLTLAYFRSEDEARAAMYWLDAFVQMFPRKRYDG